MFGCNEKWPEKLVEVRVKGVERLFKLVASFIYRLGKGIGLMFSLPLKPYLCLNCDRKWGIVVDCGRGQVKYEMYHHASWLR